MDNLIELLKKTTDFFEQKEVGEARLSAELIFAHIFNCKRLDLYMRFDEPVLEEQKGALRELIARRVKHEPIQYIIGETDFMDLLLQVDKRALIPRPETEELVQHVVDTFTGVLPRTICELGTGSGCIALSLAHAYSEARVWALDSSERALSLAQQNAQALGLSKRIQFVQSDWFSQLDCSLRFDLIISNPPYLTELEWATAESHVKDFEPKGALVGAGEDGSGCLQQIIQQATAFMQPGACLALETGIAQHSVLEQCAKQCGFSKTKSLRDMQHRDRFFMAWL